MNEKGELEEQCLDGAYYNKDSAGKITVTIPIQFKQRSDRKIISFPKESDNGLRAWDTEPTPLQQALAKGHRWMRMLESGEVSALKEIAEIENLDPSYISRMTNLTLLSPEIVEAILNDQVPAGVNLFKLGVNTALQWMDQNKFLGGGL